MRPLEHGHWYHCSHTDPHPFPLFEVNMVRPFSFSIVAFIGVPLSAQPDFKFPGMVKVDDSTFIDVKEVAVIDWAAYEMMVDGAQRPNEEVLAKLPYRYLFHSVAHRKTRALKGWSHDGWQVRWEFDKDSLRTKDQRYRAAQYLKYPIAGIPFEQAQGYCAWRTEINREAHYWDEGQGEWEVVYALPSLDLYDSLLSNTDSTNGKCALFNYSCEPCQGQLKGRESFIRPGFEVAPVNGYGPDRRGLYNLRGNAAEMTSVPGVAKGGSYVHPAKAALPGSEQRYTLPQPWLGFRCIARVRPR